MRTATMFSEGYYLGVLAEFGYTPFDLQRFDFSLAGLDTNTLNSRYLCHHNADRYLDAEPARRITTTGFGMSGPPHMATVSHLLKMVELQEGGERCQVVLGDLDAYNGKALPYGQVEDLAGRFALFARRLGFDADRGVIRCQAGHAPPLKRCTCSGGMSTNGTSTSPRRTTTPTTPHGGSSTTR